MPRSTEQSADAVHKVIFSLCNSLFLCATLCYSRVFIKNENIASSKLRKSDETTGCVVRI